MSNPPSSPTTGFTSIDLNNRSLNSSGYTSFSGQSDSNQQNRIIAKPTSTPTQAIAGINLDTIKEWSKSTFKCTRQMLFEKLGKTNRTLDPELQSEIDSLRETRKKYEYLMNLTTKMAIHFSGLLQSQKSLGDLFGELSQKTPELNEHFINNCELQKLLAKNGETLEKALNYFTSSLNTLCTKTMEDTFQTIRNYDLARLEYDAYRSDLDTMKAKLKEFTSSSRQREYLELERKHQAAKQRYEKLRSDVLVKIKFLDENKINVMEKQLTLLQNAIAAYYSGNHKTVDSLVKEFDAKIKLNNGQQSFLEQN